MHTATPGTPNSIIFQVLLPHRHLFHRPTALECLQHITLEHVARTHYALCARKQERIFFRVSSTVAAKLNEWINRSKQNSEVKTHSTVVLHCLFFFFFTGLVKARVNNRFCSDTFGTMHGHSHQSPNQLTPRNPLQFTQIQSKLISFSSNFNFLWYWVTADRVYNHHLPAINS